MVGLDTVLSQLMFFFEGLLLCAFSDPLQQLFLVSLLPTDLPKIQIYIAYTRGFESEARNVILMSRTAVNICFHVYFGFIKYL